ncbi:MAG: sulfotransferase [Leptolyngbyaceae cyanobacterium]
MDNTSRKLVFIIGIGRSGSTMLDLMLGSHSQGFSLGEISKIPEIFACHQSVEAFCPGSDFWPSHFTGQEARQLAQGLSNHRIHQRIPLRLERAVREFIRQDQIFRPYTLLFEKINSPLLVDSSKYPDWVANKIKTRELTQGTIQVYLVNVVRDARAVLNSYLRAFPDLTVEKFAHRWMNNLESCRRILNRYPAQMQKQIRYEDLATNPHSTMQSICDWLEIPFEPSMVQYWKKMHHYVAGSLSTRALIARYHNHPIPDLVQKIHGQHYKSVDLSIKLDERWKQHLDPEVLSHFYKLIGDLNRPFEWNS